jgi:hypothetical protein
MGSCISKGKTRSTRRQQNTNEIESSNNDILNAFNNENNNDQIPKSKNRRKKLKDLNTCIKCSNYRSSNSSISSSTRSQHASGRRIQTNRNFHDNNNNLDVDSIESCDDDDDVNEDFINNSNFSQSNQIVGDILNAIRAVVINK